MTSHHFYCIVSWILNAHSPWGLAWITSTSAGVGDRGVSELPPHFVPWVTHSSPTPSPILAGYRLVQKVHTESSAELGIKTVWVSQGCYNKWPWTWWLKTKETLPSSSRGQKFKPEVSAGPCSLQRIYVRILPHFFLLLGGFWWLWVILGLWQCESKLCICLHVNFFVYVFSSSSKDTCLWMKASSIESRMISSWDPEFNHIWKTLFTKKVTLTGYRWVYILGSHHSILHRGESRGWNPDI